MKGMNVLEQLTPILDQIGGFFTEAIGWLGEVLSTVTSSPVLMIMVVCMPVAGVAIGYLSRLIRL